MRCQNTIVTLVSLFFFAAVPAAALEAVYVVRHAQKNPSDQWRSLDAFRPLSSKGARCAGRLGKVLEKQQIAAVYASEVTRTLATGAAVTTTRPGVEVIGDDRTLKPNSEFVRELRDRHADDHAILVVGHSNTVADLMIAFRPDVKFCLEKYKLSRSGVSESQYGDIWRLQVGDGLTHCQGVRLYKVGKVMNVDCSTP